MARFHLNPVTGEAGQCRAQHGGCPFGGPQEHFDSKEEAMQNYETLMAGMTIPEPTAKDVAREAAIRSFEQRVIMDQEMVFAIVDPTSPLGYPMGETTLAALDGSLPAGDYDAYYTDPETGEMESARITVDGQGGALAVRVPDPAVEAAAILNDAALVEATRSAEALAGERRTSFTPDWLEEDGEVLEDEPTHGERLRTHAETVARQETAFTEAMDAVAVAERDTLAHREALAHLDTVRASLQSARAAQSEAAQAFHAAVEAKQKELVSLGDTFRSMKHLTEDGEQQETLDLYASEIDGWARAADWTTPEASNRAIRGLQELHAGLEATAHEADRRGESSEAYWAAAGPFEQFFTGTRDLTD